MCVRRCSLWVLLLGILCLPPGVAAAQTSGGGIGSASSAAGRYVDPGMNAGATLGATSGAGTTFSGGLSTSTGTTTTSGGSGTADGDVGWGPPLLVVGGVFLVYALGGWTTRLIGGTAGAGLRRRGRVRGR